MKKITLGMCCYDDFDGVYFSCQSNRLLHPEIDHIGEIIVIDNNPQSSSGLATKYFCEKTKFVRYVPFTEYQGTSIRNKVFEFAESDIVICIDCHVLLLPGAVESILDFYSSNERTAPTLLQGPMIYDDIKTETSHWNDNWAKGMHGSWARAQPINYNDDSSFEISNMGLGAFACKKSEWLGFNPLFKGFGGEEGYIHRKFKKNGGIALSHSKFKWLHRFGRPRGTPYINLYKDRIYNYFIGAFELNENPDRIIEYFSVKLSYREIKKIFLEARKDFEK